jgi:hypothetical protein
MTMEQMAVTHVRANSTRIALLEKWRKVVISLSLTVRVIQICKMPEKTRRPTHIRSTNILTKSKIFQGQVRKQEKIHLTRA